ncbi:MAG: ABC transporter ATP-binding protein, partial [Mesorhizobium sp.]
MSDTTERQEEIRTPVLTARNVLRRFGGLVAVNNVSFDVRPGE